MAYIILLQDRDGYSYALFPKKMVEGNGIAVPWNQRTISREQMRKAVKAIGRSALVKTGYTRSRQTFVYRAGVLNRDTLAIGCKRFTKPAFDAIAAWALAK